MSDQPVGYQSPEHPYPGPPAAAPAEWSAAAAYHPPYQQAPAPAPAPAEVVPVEYDGETYYIPTDTDEIAFLEHITENRIPQGIRVLIGDEAWSQFRARHRKGTDLDGFAKALQKAGLGNL